jgi:hypothetical protein
MSYAMTGARFGVIEEKFMATAERFVAIGTNSKVIAAN